MKSLNRIFPSSQWWTPKAGWWLLVGLFCIFLQAGQGQVPRVPFSGFPGLGTPSREVGGTVYKAGNLEELKQALREVNRIKRPATILLRDGLYALDIPTLHVMCPGLVIRSLSGHRDKVVIRGPDEGPDAYVRNVFLVSASNVTIADLTLGWCRWHGIQVQGEAPHNVSGLKVSNCRLVNCNEQFIKGSAGNDDVGAVNGVVEHCLFEFTSGWAYQYYTGGIDVHKGVNWIVRSNLFRNLRVPEGKEGMAEHAVHFWNRAGRAQNIVVEGNWIVNCDRGIGFGLGKYSKGLEGGSSRIQGNHVHNDGHGHATDVGIGLESACDVQVKDNVVIVENYWGPIEYRFQSSSNIVMVGNQSNRPIARRDDAPKAKMSGNRETVTSAVFQDAAIGDLRLRGLD